MQVLSFQKVSAAGSGMTKQSGHTYALITHTNSYTRGKPGLGLKEVSVQVLAFQKVSAVKPGDFCKKPPLNLRGECEEAFSPVLHTVGCMCLCMEV